MRFGWINAFGAMFVILLLIPNVIYAFKHKGEKNRCKNVWMNAAEQIGRYGCIVLMWLPLLVWDFGFHSVFETVLYLAGNGALPCLRAGRKRRPARRRWPPRCFPPAFFC